MNKLDILILIIIFLAGFSCFIIGFIRSTLDLVAIGGGIFVAVRFWPHLATWVNNLVKSETFAKWLSIVAMVTIASVIFDLILGRFQKIAEKGILGWVNNFIGAGFGVLMACLFLGMILLLFTQHGGDFLQKAIEDSQFAKPLVTFAQQTIRMVKSSIVKNKPSPSYE